MAHSTADAPPPIRLCFVQQIVPHYRVPLLERLAASPSLELEVWSDEQHPLGSLRPAKGGFRSRHAPYRTLGPLVSQPGFVEAVASGRFDAVILPWNTRCVQLFPALRRARRAGVATVLFGHGYSRREAGWRRRLRNAALRRATIGLLYSRSAADRLVAEGFAAERVCVAPNAIDQRPVQAARADWLSRPADLDAFRRRHGIAGRQLAVFVSRVEPDKRVDRLLHAHALLRRTLPQAKLAIVGGGSELDRMRSLAIELGVSESVVFTGPIYDDNDLAPWMLSAGCFAYPVAIGLSVLHAFGYGLPVVTSDDLEGHNPEIEALVDGRNGLLYRDGDLSHLASCMGQCMADSPAREALAAAALETAIGPAGYSIDRMADAIVEAVAVATRLAGRR